MRRLALVLEYDGTAYAGWQRQPNAPTVQAALEETLAVLMQAPCRIAGAGRTDAGVHALGQVAHVDTSTRLSADRICDGLNALLPRDIAVRRVVEVPPDFHARRDASLRVYRYAALTRPHPSALLRRYALHVVRPLDLDAMRTGAVALVGRHDFAAFRVLGTQTPSTVCHVRAFRVEPLGALVIMTVAADRFLRQMVRRMVGVLLAVGHGALPPESVGAFLRSRDSQQPVAPAPAHGLYLVKVLYPATRVLPPAPGSP